MDQVACEIASPIAGPRPNVVVFIARPKDSPLVASRLGAWGGGGRLHGVDCLRETASRHDKVVPPIPYQDDAEKVN